MQMIIQKARVASLGILLILSCLTCAYAQSRTATVTSERANLRDSPNATAEVKQEVPVGTLIKVLDRKAAWYVVRVGDQVGWMHGNTFRFGSGMIEPAAAAEGSISPNLESNNRRRPPSSSSGRSYINKDGERVPSPVFRDRVPAGATAQCRDGSYSFSQNRRGTCSHHGGVARWL